MSVSCVALVLGLAVGCAALEDGALLSLADGDSRFGSSLDVSSFLLQDLRAELEALTKVVKQQAMEMRKLKALSSAREAQVEELKNRSSVLENEVKQLSSAGSKKSSPKLPAKKVRVLTVIGGCSRGPGCLSRVRTLSINVTAVYTITLGGAGGGIGWHTNFGYYPGGRGAVVTVSVQLSEGTRLAFVAGCGGSTGSGRRFYGGNGGNATILADRSRGVLLAIAGGGGGGSHLYPGMHGRASEAAGDAWDPGCHLTVTPSRLLRRHFRGSLAGLGWPDVRSRVLSGSAGAVVSTGGRRRSYGGGGGGGGFNGGEGGAWYNYPGGGGGSFCDRSAGTRCSIEGGGNPHTTGFVVIERHVRP